MADRNSKFIQNWEESRKGGLKRFMLLEGSIFGVLLFILLLIYYWFTESLQFQILSIDTFYMFIWYVLGGIFIYSPAMWWYNERLYKKNASSD
jgi:hypothetical protein